MINILVTGVGAIIGYGILQSLRKQKKINLIGMDINPNAAGRIWSNIFIVSPLIASMNYLDFIKRVVKNNKVDLIIPGIEQDLAFFSRNPNIFKKHKCKVILNNKNLIKITRDKWIFHKELKKINLSARIDSAINGNFKSLTKKFGCPFILKPRKSYASKGIRIVKTKKDFSPIANDLKNYYLAQPIVGKDSEEYTVGVFGDGQGNLLASITLKRKLSLDGSTKEAVVTNIKDLNTLLFDLCKYFKPLGPTNFQFRKTDLGWKLLEINPRFSSSTSLRTAFGYNEAEMSINYFLYKKKIKQPKIRSGFAIRYIKDKVFYDRNHF